MKVAVGLSGGIDSASTALSYLKAGHEVIGLTMHLFEHQTQELNAAAQVAQQLGIKHHIVDYRAAFEGEVITPFIQAYERGETPNPCLYCNKALKYGALFDYALSLGADTFSTGHYATVRFDEHLGEYCVEKGINPRKDQSYNLFQLTQRHLQHLILPLGVVSSKQMVRDAYAEYHEAHAKKQDSQGICFIERGKQTHFLKSRGSHAAVPGTFVDTEGRRLGKHQGMAHYTIGQKKGLGQALSGKFVVIGLAPERNAVILGDEAQLYVNEVTLTDFNWLNTSKPETRRVNVKTSQWSPSYDALLTHSHDGLIKLAFDAPVRGLTHGQGIVCYDGNRLIGGAIYRNNTGIPR